MPRFLVGVLQALVAAAFLIGLYAQFVVIPMTAADQVELFPPYAPIRVPLVTAAIAFVACGQAALVGLSMLLRRAGRGTVFKPSTLTWANVVVGATAAATVVTAAVFGYVTLADIPSPVDGMDVLGLWLGTAAAVVAGTAAVLLLVAGRHLPAKAIGLRTELDGVV
ncbi:DUF2975 domain-containing protein [Amycolatopsis mongoliensis]|uniref:DUF2975 domain-containing protein n=1 Tax=Amycolatopsis mongoliensis TaxID=715475 RepID=A0A9Y2NJ38_9PSEU|nr:DUF2975 domain-containing protein [Amycolatopsis sp. 4-36]WIX99744.1 DUF2975 domain-containing protein [Amycolatopsis sp. 4-36]